VCIDKSHIEAVMYGRKKSLLTSVFLRMLSLLYGSALLIRRGMYFLGVVQRKKTDQFIISVGNITVGGTGKTPAVMNIATILMNAGKRPAVVSRGYGRLDESSLVIVSDGSRVLADSRTGGDEPVLIGSAVPGLPVVVGRDRFKAACLAHERFGNDVVILDDGFQHVRLQRDLDIVLIDAGDPFGKGALFPAGILREPVSALNRAGAVLITGADRAANLESLRKTVRQRTGAPIFSSRLVPKDLVEVMTGEVKQLVSLQDATVIALSGIARPASFVSLLGSLGAVVKEKLIFPDHHAYSQADLAQLFQRAADCNAGMIVTTEKDAVRLRSHRPEGVWALRVELSVAEQEEWKSFLLRKL
jgi:tetraacyldisaccharide 4'-kinase